MHDCEGRAKCAILRARWGCPDMAWFVYMLRCGDGSLYTGCTDDVQRRLAVHRSGKGAKYTRSRLPVELAYQEEASDRSAALRREAAIKKLTRQEKLRLIEAAENCRTERADCKTEEEKKGSL